MWDYKRHLKRERKLAASTVNLTLAALDHYAWHLGLVDADVRREELPSVLDADTAALFVSRRGGRLTVRSIRRVVAKLGEVAGLQLSPHVLRHACFTRLVRSGVDLVTVAELVGHRPLETTRR